ncbi:MAG TPA: 1-deoxy-D-xylulose-5-phosphate reductoisomerase [Burkholderiales bacterium]|jgi:1-deoxy-D-xylulose-5-phosphate reductoisomerase|nr:1-deoxy-D-xylulose-5-phosphate reductoisomerase [Burkholderiales bacterium]
MPSLQNLTILGSTGSVGASTLDVVQRHPERFRVIALTAHTQSAILFAQCVRHRPRYAVISQPKAAEDLARQMKRAGLDTQVLCGAEALEYVASLPEVDTVMAAIVGIAGLKPTIVAAEAGKKLLLANKEALVTAGAVLMQAARAGGAHLLPIDSEHNAVFQALPRSFTGDLKAVGVRRILLTASGGPFRETALSELVHVSPEAACAHPNWTMGRKISVDSATMMNKGLEVIEAYWLFNASADQIEVVIHPESVVHSLVEYVDGSVIAQLGNPDMRTPIAHALAYPERIDAGVKFLDLARTGVLHFEEPDTERFPCLRLAYEALSAGGRAPAILNAANEIAVARFLAGEIAFPEIPRLIQDVLARCEGGRVEKLEDVLEADRAARLCAERCLAERFAGTRGNASHSSPLLHHVTSTPQVRT